MLQIVESILATVGPGPVRLSGACPAELATALRSRGCPVDASTPTPTITLIAVDRLADLEDRDAGPAQPTGALVVWNRWTGDGAPPLRAACDDWLLNAGYRRHPAALDPDGYAGLDRPELPELSFFETIPAAAACRPGQPGRCRDRLRAGGPRADAAILRYALAAQWVRTGDIVLDCACGSGYGSAVLAARSAAARVIGLDADAAAIAYAQAHYGDRPGLEFQAGDLAALPAASVGLVVSFETLDHQAEPDRFLAEVARVLRPDGRFIAGVPNRWIEEPGPGLLFDRPQFQALLARHLLVEAEYHQTAPGGVKLVEAGPLLMRVDPDNPDTGKPHPTDPSGGDTEWLILVASADPLAVPARPYHHPAFHPPKPAPVPPHVDFAASYNNPWIYRPIVQLGERLDHPALLDAVIERLLASAPRDSADYGAALCVKGYQVLERDLLDLDAAGAVIAAVADYRAGPAADSHVRRWRLSLAFLAGRLSMAGGRFDAALDWFRQVVEDDPLTFSPLLATKTVAAWFWTGILELVRGAEEPAAAAFRGGIAAAAAALGRDPAGAVGGLDRPLPFGFPELAEVADVGGQCALALARLPLWRRAPGLFWRTVDARRFGLATWARQLMLENNRLIAANFDWLRRNYDQAVIMARQDSRIEQLQTTLALVRQLALAGADEVVIYGAGAIGQELAAALAGTPCRCRGAIDRNPDLHGQRLLEAPIVALADAPALGCDTIVVASVAFKDAIVGAIEATWGEAGRTPRILTV